MLFDEKVGLATWSVAVQSSLHQAPVKEFLVSQMLNAEGLALLLQDCAETLTLLPAPPRMERLIFTPRLLPQKALDH